ncbi:MAG: hypothetical protein JW888_13460 [Pirellulales bacterium]|nr:hypothetical protein [Pirellulales bacterium]
MAKYFCPRCGIPLSEEYLLMAGEQFDCPDCNRAVNLGQIAPELVRQLAEQQRLGVEETTPGGRMQCRLIDQELVIYIPPGTSKSARSMGCFAVFWLGFMVVFTSAWIGTGQMFQGEGPWFLIPILSLFWLIGLGMLYGWLRGRYGKVYVLVEANRLVKRFELFGREKMREYTLDENSKASLVESFRLNNQPVHAVSVTTTGRPAKFGTFFSREEKDWLVRRINRHLDSPSD